METVPEDLVSEALHHTLALCQRGNCYNGAHADPSGAASAPDCSTMAPFLAWPVKLGISHHFPYCNAEHRYLALNHRFPNHFKTSFRTTSQLRPA